MRTSLEYLGFSQKGKTERPEIAEVRRTILDKLLFVFSLLGLPAVSIGATQSYMQGRWGFSVAYAGIYLLFVAATLASRQLPYRFRALVLVFSLYLIALAILIRIGMSGVGLQLMLGVGFLAAVLFGLRGGAFAILVILATIGLVASGMTTGFIDIFPEHMLTSRSAAAWFTAVFVFFMIVSITVIAPEMLRRRIEESLDLLEEQRKGLEAANESLRREIKGREEVEATLRESEARFEVFMDHLPASAFMKDEEGRMLYANRFLQDLFGWTDAVGKSVSDLLPPEMADQMAADDRAVLAGGPATISERIVDREGQERFFQTHKFPIRIEGHPTLLGGIAVDITARKRAEEALGKSEAVLKSVFKAAPVGISIMKNRIYQSVNDFFHESLGYAEQDMIGKDPRMLYETDEEFERVGRDLYDHLQERGLTSAETRMRRRDGLVRDVVVNVAPLHGDDPSAGTVGVIYDVTERKRAEEAVRESEARYRNIFDSAAVAIWEEDFSPVKSALDGLKASGIEDLRGYLDQHPEFVSEVAGTVRVLDVNDHCVKSYGAGSKEGLLGAVHRIFLPETLNAFSEEMIAIAEGRRHFQAESVNQTLQGERRNILITISFPEPESPFDSVLVTTIDVTDARRAEEAARTAEKRFRQVVEIAPWGIFLEVQGCLVYVNPAFMRLTGAERPEQLIGTSLLDWVPPESWEKVTERIRTVNNHRTALEPFERKHIRLDGTMLDVEAVAVPFDVSGQPGGMGMVRDITERKRAEEALRAKTEELESFFTTALDLLCIADTDGNFQRLNREWEKVLGYPLDELEGRRFLDFIHPEDMEATLAAIAELESQKEVLSLTNRYRCKDGSYRWVEWRSLPAGKRIYVAARDVTERIRAEEEIRRHRDHLEELVGERTRELLATQEELIKRERLAVLGQLTATVSHELRNPLGVIRSSAFYLQEKMKGGGEKIRKHLNRIEAQVDLCDSIVGELLEYTRGGHVELVEEEIHPWLERVLGELQGAEGIRIRKAFSQGFPQVALDPLKMGRVVMNVLHNSIHAVREKVERKTGESGSYEPQIHVRTALGEGEVLIEVEDNGIGMDEETARRAFDPLFTTKARGTGLGLAIVKKIMEEHGGRVGLESGIHRGTKVILGIPVRRDAS